MASKKQLIQNFLDNKYKLINNLTQKMFPPIYPFFFVWILIYLFDRQRF